MLFELYDPSGWIAEFFERDHALLTESAGTSAHADDRAVAARDATYAGLIVGFLRDDGGDIDMEQIGPGGLAYLRSALAEDAGVLRAAELAVSSTATTVDRAARYEDMKSIIDAILTIDELEPALAA